MTTARYSLRDPLHGELRRRQPQENECDAIAGCASRSQKLRLPVSSASRLKGETPSLANKLVDAVDHHPIRRNGICLRVERRQAARNLVGVEELAQFQQIGRASCRE